MMAAVATLTSATRLKAVASQVGLWWLRQWRACLPDAFRVAPTEKGSVRLSIEAGDQEVRITFAGADGAEIFCERTSRADYTPSILDLCLSKARSLARGGDVAVSLVIPSAICGSLPIPSRAQGQAEAIIRDHITRRTPLSLDQLFVAYDLKPAGAGKLDLRYLVLPRVRLDHLVGLLGLAPTEIHALESPASDGTGLVRVPTLRRTHATTWGWQVTLALPFVALLVATAAFCIQAWRQSVMLDEIETRVAKEVVSARQSAKQLQGVYGMVEDLARVAEMRGAPGVVQVWEELARILPDSTYLTEVEVREAEVVVTGFSDAAPALIRLLEGSQTLHDASFTGPVVQDRARGKEQFSLRMSLRKPRFPTEEAD